MTPEQWQRIKSLLPEAMSLPPEQRSGFIKDCCEDDAVVYGELLRMVHQADTTHTFLQPIVDWGSEKHTFQPGELVLDRFRIVRFIGRGGMGEVYEAEDRHLGRVALKTIRSDLAANRQHLLRFEQEVQLARKVTDPHVCRIHDLFVVPGQETARFLTMQFLEGETLANRIEMQGPLPVAEAEAVALQLCSALQAIHDAGVIHRDFKSNNVMLVTKDGATQAVVMDLGLAREAALEHGAEAGLTLSGAVMGTPEYMAPEQFSAAAVTRATDIYALGIVLYEMATGSRPFHAPTPLAAAVLRAKKPSAASSVRPEIPRQWDQVINRCLEFEPEQRYQSAQEVATALASSQKSLPRPRRFPFPLRRVVAVAIPVLIAALAGLWEFHSRIWKTAPPEQRVAVLEFENIGGDAGNRAFCQGLTEMLAGQLTELEQFQGSLSVVPASDVRGQKVTSAREAQREFGVNLVITGSVQRSPGGVRLIFNVVDARELKQLRSHNLFVPLTDAVTMQEGVIKQVVDLLDVELRPEARRRLTAGNTTVPGAYDFYLQGSGYLLEGTRGTDQAITEFQQALNLDHDYALARAGLGRAYWNKYLVTRDPAWIKQAWEECRRAIALNPGLAAAHMTLSMLNSGAGHYDEAIREAEKAIQIDPGDYQAYGEMARALERLGRTNEAEATLQKAIALRPNYWYSYGRLASLYLRHARYKDAEPLYQRIIALVPDNPTGYTNLGIVYHLQGRESEAEVMLKKSLQVRPTPEAESNLATVYFFMGQYSSAARIMEQVVAAGERDYVVWGNLADDYRWAPGMADKARAAYQRAIQLSKQALEVNSNDAQALSSLALYEVKIGDTANALAACRKALSAAPHNAPVLFNAAVVFEIAGKRKEALEYLGTALERGYSLNEIVKEPELAKLRQDPAYVMLTGNRQTGVGPKEEPK